jgi:ABC-type sugar transport system permease subunit
MNKLGLISRNKWTPYLYVLPVVILILFIYVYPLISIFRYSLISQQGDKEVFVGLANFKFISSDFIFWKGLLNNLTLLLAVPILTILALVVSISLYERMRGWQFYRSLIFMPFVLPSVVIGVVFIYLLEKDGIINTILQSLGLGTFALDWLGNVHLALPTLMGVIIWRELGFGVVLLLAAMLALSEELNEAARLDGANWFQEHIYVTIPQLKPVLTFFIVNEAITMISWVFGYVYVVTGGGPGFATTVLELYIWKYAFAYKAYGVASAVAVILLLITFAVMMFGLRGIFDEEGENS